MSDKNTNKMEEQPIKGIGIFQFEPEIFGWTFDKKALKNWIIAIALFIFTRWIPIPGLAYEGRVCLGILLGCMVLWAIKGGSKVPVCFLMLVLGCAEGIMTYGTIASNLGTTPFIMLGCMLMFSAGMSNTKMAERISYFLLDKLGTSPFAIVAALFITEIIVSAFIANMPALVVVAAIAAGILRELDQKPGSKLGTAIFVAITTGSLVGGLCFISSSGMNTTAISVLEAATNGEYTITYPQWAAIGVPFAIFLTPCCLLILKLLYKLDKKHYNISLSKESVKQKRADLGPMTNAEKRFFLSLIAMTILFLTSSITKLAVPQVAMIGFVLVALPGIGSINTRNTLRTLPWDVIFMAIANTVFAVSITSTGLGAWIVNLLLGWAINLPTILLIVVVCIAGIYCHYISVSTPTALLVPAAVALAVSAGIAPALVFVPIIFTASCTVLMPIATDTMITYEHGYWEFKDMIVAGNLVAIPWIIGATLIPYIVVNFTNIFL